MAGYYYLVATLNEFTLSGDSSQLDFLAIRNEIVSRLSKKDEKLLCQVLSYWDIQNFLNALNLRDTQFSIIGNYTREEIAETKKIYVEILEKIEKQNSLNNSEEVEEEIVEDAENNDKHSDSVELLDVFKTVFRALQDSKFAKRKHIDTTKDISNLLFTQYYSQLDNSGKKFIREWSNFDRNVKNLSAAYEARRVNKAIDSYIIGDDKIAETIKQNSSLEDFGLSEIDWTTEILKIISMSDILKKERALDNLRWQFLEKITIFEYFNINFIISYVLRLTIVSRWLLLDEKIGREMFDKLVGAITSSEHIVVED